jgi:UDP-N-acetylglucosamine--N-acetylmuramyl-(pentapeptide) pyrophosphoryl-undecaprenol N-acetylglucosamine transferase
VVVGTGGYASGPLLKAATNQKEFQLYYKNKILTQELLIRYFQKKQVRFVWLTKGWSNSFLKKKSLLTGNPVRQDID